MSCESQVPEVGESRGDGTILQVRQEQEKKDREEGTCSVFVVMAMPSGMLEGRTNGLFHKEQQVTLGCPSRK